MEVPDLLGKKPTKSVFISDSNLHISKVSLSKGIANVRISNIFDYVEGSGYEDISVETIIKLGGKFIKKGGK
jgi:hypothetical protein